MKIDRLKIAREQVAFAETDTICFFAPSPRDLNSLQRREWQPAIDWINGFGCDFKASESFAVQNLSDRTKTFLENRLKTLSDEALLSFCAVSGGCRSVILALAVLDGFMTADRAFDLAVLEESYQNRSWKQDEEALAARENRKKAVLEAAAKLKGNNNG